RNLNRGLGPVERFLEGDLEVVAQIGAALRAATPAPPAKDVAEAEESAETAEDVFEPGEHGRIESACARARAAHPGMAEAVVQLALLRVGKDRRGVGAFLDELLGRVIPGV